MSDNRSEARGIDDAQQPVRMVETPNLDAMLEESQANVHRSTVFEKFLEPAFMSAMQKQARILANSGVFMLKCMGGKSNAPRNADDERLAIAEVYARIQTGAEYGIPPTASLREIFIVEGRPCFSAKLMQTLLKRSGVFRFKILKADAEECELKFFEKLDGHWVDLGNVGWTMADASKIEYGYATDRSGNAQARKKLVDKDNWRNYPADMLFARAMSRGCRRFAAEIFFGAIYTVDEAEEISTNDTTFLAGHFGTADITSGSGLGEATAPPAEPDDAETSGDESEDQTNLTVPPNSAGEFQQPNQQTITPPPSPDEAFTVKPAGDAPGPVATRGGPSGFLAALDTPPAGEPDQPPADEDTPSTDDPRALTGLKTHRGAAKTILDGLEAGHITPALFREVLSEGVDAKIFPSGATNLADFSAEQAKQFLHVVNVRIDEAAE